MKKVLETLYNIYKIEELRERVILTLGMLLVYRLGAQVVLPGIDSVQLAALSSRADGGGLLGILNAFTGGAFANASIFAPYPGMKMTQIAIDKGYFDGDYDKIDTTYYASSVLKFDNPKDENKIYNLRCFFSLENPFCF